MKEHKNEELNEFLRKALLDVELNQAPKGFADKLFVKLEQINVKSEATVYEPLISKSAWLVIVVLMVSICSYFIFEPSSDNPLWVPSVALENIININFFDFKLPELYLSKITMYSMYSLSFFFAIQVVFLKRLFSTRHTIL